MNDPYAVLEVGQDADANTIRRAFRRLARELHPDLNAAADAEERFRALVDAYAQLSDPNTQPSPAQSEPGEASLFQEAARRWAADGQDVLTVAHLDLVTSIVGGRIDVRVRGPVTCAPCQGTGFDREGPAVICWTCSGTGRVTFTNRFGESSGTCLNCGGERSQPTRDCTACSGRGTVNGERTVSVHVPEGTGDGETIVVPGAGGPGGRSGSAGDLLVVVAIARHPVYTRVGLDLRIVVPLSFVEAVTGADIVIPTFEGPLTVRIPHGTQGGTVFRVEARGVRSGAERGDLLVTTHVTVPTDLSTGDISLLERMPDGGASKLRTRLFDAMSDEPSL